MKLRLSEGQTLIVRKAAIVSTGRTNMMAMPRNEYLSMRSRPRLRFSIFVLANRLPAVGTGSIVDSRSAIFFVSDAPDDEVSGHVDNKRKGTIRPGLSQKI